MDAEVDSRELAVMLKAKRGTRSLRAIAEEIGGSVSVSTLSRVEQGNVPDLTTFMRLCRWLGVSPERFMSPAPAVAGAAAGPDGGLSTEEIVTAHLRADQTLPPETANALATMIKLAYEAAKRGDI